MTGDVQRQREFDCAECGQHIIAFADPTERQLCAACLTLPGWFNYPQLVEILAPEGLPNLPEHERRR